MKQLIFFISVVIICISCSEKESPPLRIDFYTTETTDKIYPAVLYCDSALNSELNLHPIDTSLESIAEQIKLKQNYKKSIYISIATNPILGRMSNIYYEMEGKYKFSSPVLFAQANIVDTAKLSSWLREKKYKSDKFPNYNFKWFVDYKSKDEAYLVALKKSKPLLSIERTDLADMEINAEMDLINEIKIFTGERMSPNFFSLSIVLKSATIEKLKKVLPQDTSIGYLAIINAGGNEFLYDFKREEIIKTKTLDKAVFMDKQEIKKYKLMFGID